jgi:hypothetical protein
VPVNRTRRRGLVICLTSVGVIALLVVGAFVWSAPRDDVPLPGTEAKPEQVVLAYLDAVNARDFDTANAILDPSFERYGRFSRPVRTERVHITRAFIDGGAAHVLFSADFQGGDGSIGPGRQPWGYDLRRDDDGRWRIVDAGVA